MTEERNPEPQSATELEQGSEQAAVAALLARDKPEPEDKPAESVAEEVAEETTEEVEPEEEEVALVKVEIEGKEYEIPPEVEKAVLRQSDYSRKMNEVGTLEKAVQAREKQSEMILTNAVQIAQALAVVNGMDEQIARFDKLDWQSLRGSNPSEYAALMSDFQALKQGRAEAMGKVNQIDAEVSKAKQASMQEARGKMAESLQKNLKGWGDELGSKITKYAVENGYSVDELQSTTDARWVIAMDKARRYDELQNSKQGLKEKMQSLPKVVKPGQPVRRDNSAELSSRLRNTGSQEDAIALLKARFK